MTLIHFRYKEFTIIVTTIAVAPTQCIGRESEGDVLDEEDRALEGELSDGGWDDPGPEGGMPDGELENDSVVNDRDAPETEGEAPD